MKNPHDKFFKEVFSHTENAVDFIRGVFPEGIKNKLDYTSLKLEKDSYITKELKEFFSDIVYTVKYQGDKTIKISLLFEHKSYRVKYPHFQILQYLVNIWKFDINNKRGLHPVIPIVIYHGKEKWEYRSFSSCFDGIDEELARFIPCFDYLLSDLSGLSHGEIKGRIFTEVSLEIALSLMKHIFDEEQLRKYLKDIFEVGRMYYEEEKGLEFLECVLRYLFGSTEISEKEVIKILTQISMKGGEQAMTTAEMLIDKGKREGKREGKLEDAKVMLLEGLEISFISKVTGLSETEIAKLK